MMSPITEKRILRFGLLLLILHLAFRLVYITQTDIHPDEAYYWGLGDRPEWSFYDHPPLVAYAIHASTSLLGKNEFAVRFPGVIFSTFSGLVVMMFAMELFQSAAIAVWSLALMMVVPAYNINGLIITPDAPQFFFWILAGRSYWRAVRADRLGDWISGGIALGLGLLSKYTVIFLVPTLFLFLIATPAFRPRLWSRGLWLSLGIGFLLFSPVILWNLRHDFISFRFQLHHGLDQSIRPFYDTLIEFLGGQAGIISPILFFLMLSPVFRFNSEGEIHDDPRRYLRFLFAFSFLFFAFQSLRSKVEANWPGYCYATAFILLAHDFHSRAREFAFRRLFVGGFILALAMSLLILAQGIKKVLPIPMGKDATCKLRGWSELGREIIRLQRDFNFDIIVARGPTLCSLIRFYTPFQTVYEIQGKGHYFKWNRAIPANSRVLLVSINDTGLSTFRDHFVTQLYQGELSPVREARVLRTFSLGIYDKFVEASGQPIILFPAYQNL